MKKHSFTSTGAKFWKHPNQMLYYPKGTGRSIISTHISPEGSCNLNCSYCSVKKRTKNFRIEFDVIKDYIEKLQTRGLKAVILTGGGEPVLYPYFNELVTWLKERDLEVALITNGTLNKKIEVWEAFSWIRVSINDIENWRQIIFNPRPKLSRAVTLGCSLIYTGQSIDFFREVSLFVREMDASGRYAKYVRVLPDCLITGDDLLDEYRKINTILDELNDPLFFCQNKIHKAPDVSICHQSYFRPYLSEVDGGTVYPCDSVVLNDGREEFSRDYQICRAENILKFLDGEISFPFNANIKCTGCVFTTNINMLERWKKDYTISNFIGRKLGHVNFV